MLGTLVSTKTKCIKLIFIGKITVVPVAFLMALSIVYEIQFEDFQDGRHDHLGNCGHGSHLGNWNRTILAILYFSIPPIQHIIPE